MSPPPAAACPEISLIIPCFDEEEVVGQTVADLFLAFGRAGIRLELVAVDNGSRDRTGEILAALARTHPGLVIARVDVNRGYGNGVLAGLTMATAPWVGILCADAQVAAEDVVLLYGRAVRSDAWRLHKVRRRFRRDGLRRKIVSVVYNLAMAVLFPGLGTLDVNGNPKIFPRAWVERMQLESKDWFLDSEIMIQARRLGFPVVEVDVIGHARSGGASNVRASTCWEFVVNVCAARFGGRGRRGRVSREASPREGAAQRR